MKISVDHAKCEKSNRCFNMYLGLFEADADGKGQVKPGMENVPEELEMDAQSAANACPKGAINVEY